MWLPCVPPATGHRSRADQTGRAGGKALDLTTYPGLRAHIQGYSRETISNRANFVPNPRYVVAIRESQRLTGPDGPATARNARGISRPDALPATPGPGPAPALPATAPGCYLRPAQAKPHCVIKCSIR